MTSFPRYEKLEIRSAMRSESAISCVCPRDMKKSKLLQSGRRVVATPSSGAAAAGVVLTMAAFGLAGCTGHHSASSEPSPSGRLVIGQTLDQSDLPGTLIAYDVSPTVLGEPATYNANAGSNTFTVIAGCRVPPSFKEGDAWAVALVPHAKATPAIVSKAKERGFSNSSWSAGDSLRSRRARSVASASVRAMTENEVPVSAPVRQLRLVVNAADFEEALRFYRDELGLPELAAFEGDDDARVSILFAGAATLELSNAAQVRMIDEVEADGQPSERIRVAFAIEDAAGMTRRLVDGGAELIAEPRETPWKSINSRLQAPADLQITLFQELDSAKSNAHKAQRRRSRSLRSPS